ncbi:MAG: T9SS type A sorting domain-containing protein [Ignavibacteria bacterium]|nr:T9SS type A sorting domain-containing protein [Ignavibacteria bacterium]
MLKNLYSLIFTVLFTFLFISNSNAQFFDNFDSYTSGQGVACQNPTDWTTWSNAPCGSEDATVSTTYSYSSPNSARVITNNDFVKTFGSQTTGTWYVQFWIYIPNGKAGYFNLMAGFPSPFNWAMDCFFDAGGGGRIFGGSGTAVSFTYAYDTWHFVGVVVNLTADQGQLWFNGVLIHSWQWTLGSSGGGSPLELDAIDFYGNTANDDYYIDDFWFHSSPIPVELTSFTANVNPLGQAVLNWVTATEINNRGFEIERKAVEDQFITIGFVEGYGTTSEEQTYSYVDQSVTPGVYAYRLKQIDFNGQFEYSEEVELEVTAPLAFGLDQNYPNPFNPNTNIKYSLSEPGNVKLAIYNTLGEEIQVLVNSYKEAGSYELSFNAAGLPSGTYIYRLEAPGYVEAKKMILMK